MFVECGPSTMKNKIFLLNFSAVPTTACVFAEE